MKPSLLLLIFLSQVLRADESAIHSITVGQVCPVSASRGDTWDAAWMSDGSLYSPSNDTNGFHGSGDSNLMFNQITGDAPTSSTASPSTK